MKHASKKRGVNQNQKEHKHQKQEQPFGVPKSVKKKRKHVFFQLLDLPEEDKTQRRES